MARISRLICASLTHMNFRVVASPAPAAAPSLHENAFNAYMRMPSTGLRGSGMGKPSTSATEISMALSPFLKHTHFHAHMVTDLLVVATVTKNADKDKGNRTLLNKM